MLTTLAKMAEKYGWKERFVRESVIEWDIPYAERKDGEFLFKEDEFEEAFQENALRGMKFVTISQMAEKYGYEESQIKKMLHLWHVAFTSQDDGEVLFREGEFDRAFTKYALIPQSERIQRRLKKSKRKKRKTAKEKAALRQKIKERFERAKTKLTREEFDEKYGDDTGIDYFDVDFEEWEKKRKEARAEAKRKHRETMAAAKEEDLKEDTAITHFRVPEEFSDTGEAVGSEEPEVELPPSVKPQSPKAVEPDMAEGAKKFDTQKEESESDKDPFIEEGGEVLLEDTSISISVDVNSLTTDTSANDDTSKEESVEEESLDDEEWE